MNNTSHCHLCETAAVPAEVNNRLHPEEQSQLMEKFQYSEVAQLNDRSN